jgi:ribosomal protein S27AE
MADDETITIRDAYCARCEAITDFVTVGDEQESCDRCGAEVAYDPFEVGA